MPRGSRRSRRVAEHARFRFRLCAIQHFAAVAHRHDALHSVSTSGTTAITCCGTDGTDGCRTHAQRPHRGLNSADPAKVHTRVAIACGCCDCFKINSHICCTISAGVDREPPTRQRTTIDALDQIHALDQ